MSNKNLMLLFGEKKLILVTCERYEHWVKLQLCHWF